MMRQLITPLYMLFQSVFVIVQYRITTQQFGVAGLNALILMLSAAIPFQLFNLGIGHAIYAKAENHLATRRQIAALKIIMVSSVIGLPLTLITLRLFSNQFDPVLLATSAIFLFCANLNNFLFLVYDGSGLSYVRSLLSGLVSLFILLISGFVAPYFMMKLPNPLFWFAVSYIVTSILLVSPFILRWNSEPLDALNIVKEGWQFNLMMLPSLFIDFIIKTALTIYSPILLPFFDLVNKLLQQLGSLITMLNQAIAQKIKSSDEYSVARLSIISVSAFLISNTVIYILLPFFLEYTGIVMYENGATAFFAITVGWLFNTLSAPWYFKNIFQGKVMINTQANILILFLLLGLGWVGIKLNWPLYFVWMMVLVIGSLRTIGLQNLSYTLEVASIDFALLGIAISLNLLSIKFPIIIVLSGLLYLYVLFRQITVLRQRNGENHVNA